MHDFQSPLILQFLTCTPQLRQRRFRSPLGARCLVVFLHMAEPLPPLATPPTIRRPSSPAVTTKPTAAAPALAPPPTPSPSGSTLARNAAQASSAPVRNVIPSEPMEPSVASLQDSGFLVQLWNTPTVDLMLGEQGYVRDLIQRSVGYAFCRFSCFPPTVWVQ
jgi:hypothetical protein